MSYNDLILLNIHYGENTSQGTTRFKVKVWFCLCLSLCRSLGSWRKMAGELVKWGRLWSEAGECLSPREGDHGLLGQHVSPSLALPDHIPSLRSPLPFPLRAQADLRVADLAPVRGCSCRPLRALLPPSRACWASVSWQMSQPRLLGVRLWGADREPCAEVPLSLAWPPNRCSEVLIVVASIPPTPPRPAPVLLGVCSPTPG